MTFLCTFPENMIIFRDIDVSIYCKICTRINTHRLRNCWTLKAALYSERQQYRYVILTFIWVWAHKTNGIPLGILSAAQRGMWPAWKLPLGTLRSPPPLSPGFTMRDPWTLACRIIIAFRLVHYTLYASIALRQKFPPFPLTLPSLPSSAPRSRI